MYTEAQKKHYQQNKEKYAASLKNRRIERAKWWANYKEEQNFSCQKCGENHPACISFHHRNSVEKTMGVSDLVGSAYSIEVILAEVNKCDVLCHNCHAKHHWLVDDRRRNR